MRNSYDHNADDRVRNEAPWHQRSSVGIVSGPVVSHRGFNRAKDDAEEAVLHRSLDPLRSAECCVIAAAPHT